MNGTLDKGNPALVNMNIIGPAGTWDPAAGSCSGVACHGAAPLLWYGTNTWTTPTGCTNCHDSSFSSTLDPTVTNGNPPNGRHVKHVASRNIGCERCHYRYPAKTAHANGLLDTPDPSINITNFNIVGTSGAWINDTGLQTGQCADISCHGTDTLAWYGQGTWTLPASCTTCHSSSYSSQLDPLVTNGSGLSGKHIRHVTSFNFACSKCHLNYPSNSSHASGIMDTQDPTVLIVAFDATNPTGTWINDSGAQTGTCSSLYCHNLDADWYGLAGVTLPPCAICHINAIGTRRQIMGTNGDFGANSNITSHHVTRGPGSDPLTDQCLVCHEMSMHMGGTVRVKDADTGTAIAYDPGSPSTLEPFCISCHDSNGATATLISGGSPTNPFNDGSALGRPPYPYSTRIASSWAKSYGHGSNGNHASGSKLTCLGTGQPGTGCHGNAGSLNAHGSMNQVLSAGTFKYDLIYNGANQSYTESDFGLCFTCHASYGGVTKEDVFGVKFGGLLDAAYGPFGPRGQNPPYDRPAGIVTHFADHNVAGAPFGLNDYSFWGTADMNLHWFHIGAPTVAFRGLGTLTTGITCVNCHDVHGSNTPYGAVYDEMGYMNFGDGTNLWGQMTLSAYSTSLLNSHPFYCAFNCHPVQDVTKAWFYPIAE
ncbi:MAG TPA: hypothetical protein VF905_10450 [Nitrospirota bacterium]